MNKAEQSFIFIYRKKCFVDGYMRDAGILIIIIIIIIIIENFYPKFRFKIILDLT